MNKIPPEILCLIPDFLIDSSGGDVAIRTLTHVCKAWREAFTSYSSLWTGFRCIDPEKTRVYLQRSKSSPINLQLERDTGIPPNDPFFQIIPHAISRLESLSISTTPGHLQDIISHFTHPAPLLEDFSISGGLGDPERNSALTPTLFGGDFHLLRRLRLQSVHTDLPWRNMANLTSFSLRYVLRPGFSIELLLDFFESAPHLSDVELTFAIPDFGARIGRLVPLAYLKTLRIYGIQSPSMLLEHLLISASAKLSTTLPSSQIEDHLPSSLDNLKNLSDFTAIYFHFEPNFVAIKFTGPNGQVCLTSLAPASSAASSAFQSLA